MKTLIALCSIFGAASVFLVAQTMLPAGSEALAPPTNETNAPTLIQSRSGQFLMKSNVFIYRGDVHVDNPKMKLTCGLLTVEAPRLATGKFNRATAETNVIIDFVNGAPPNFTTNHATSDKAVYTYILTNVATTGADLWQTSSIIVLTGHPVVTNSQVTYQSDPIIMDRIADTITSTNFLNMTVNQSTSSNSPGLFDTSEPKSTAPKINAPPR
jgi:lipopolysaccharide export system protein LptA